MFAKGDQMFYRGDKGPAAKSIAAGAETEGDLDCSAGQILMKDGSASSPGIAFKNATNYGLYKGVNTLGIAVNAQAKLAVTLSYTRAYTKLWLNDGLGLDPETVKTSSPYNMLSGDMIVIMNAGAGQQVNLPADPGTTQHVVFIRNLDGSNNLTVGRNGNNIDGAASDLTVAAGEAVVLAWDDATGGWYKVS